MNCLEKKNKTTEIVTVKELLSNTKIGQNCFRIPDYQRGYAWESQFEDLWKDILRVFNSGTDTRHYTGMLLLEEMNDQSKQKERLVGTNAFYVVDGQQRLTSLIIIVKALLEYIKDECGEDLEEDLLTFDEGIYRFDYSVDRIDDAKEYFKNRIFKGDKNNACADMYLKNINNAKEFVDSNLIKYDVNQVKQMLNIVLNKIVFNIYFIGKGFDVRVTFETMNNRGKQLSNLELLKNRLMYLTTFIKGSNQGQFNYESLLKDKINTAWKNIYKNICYADYQLNDDEYLQAHWIVYGTLDKSKGDTYIRDILNKRFSIDEGTFHDYIMSGSFRDAYLYLYNYVDSLDMYSKYWGIINNPIERSNLIQSTDETLWLDRLNRIASLKYVKSTIMVVAGETQLTKEHKVLFYKTIERALFINKLLGRLDNDFSVLIKNARELRAAQTAEKVAALNQLIDAIENGEYSCGLDNIKKSIVNFGLYINDRENFYYSWDDIRYFLYEYNEWLGLDKNAKTVSWKLIDNNSIEHILPQTPSKQYWKIVLEQETDDGKVKKATNSLGNLLLLSQGENSSMQNYSFPTKKKVSVSANKFAYIYGSRSAQKVAEKKYWTLHEIYKREIELFEFIFDRWIDTDDAPISKKDFLNLVRSNNLLIDKYKPLSTDDKKRLDALDLSSERTPARSNTRKPREWYDALRNYFDTNTYGLNFNPKKMSYLKDKFTFTKRDNCILCGFNTNDKTYRFNYHEVDGTLIIHYWNTDSKEWETITDESALNEGAKYFLRTFNRYLRRYCGKTNAVVVENR